MKITHWGCGVLVAALALLQQTAWALSVSDAGTYELLKPDGGLTGALYRLGRTKEGKWISRGKLPDEEWKDTSCDSGCQYRDTTVEEIGRYFPPRILNDVNVACIQNTEMAFCGYTGKADPARSGHIVVVLTTAIPTPVNVRRIASASTTPASMELFENDSAPPGAATAISPIYSQLLRFSLPRGFVTRFEQTNGDSYLREAVPAAETVENWTQMLTVTGARNLALRPLTPKQFAEGMAGGFQRKCPESFSARSIGDGKIGGFEAMVIVASCGTSPTTHGTTSETAMLVVIRGQQDFYTIQWAERSARSASPMQIDAKKWDERLHQLTPIKLCPIVRDERPPYASCL